MIKKVLTIAGSDSSGGAGIQADLKTISALGAYGMSVITAVTSQNTMGITDICRIPPDSIASQIEAVLSDIETDAVKIGMLTNAGSVHAVCGALEKYAVRNIVFDPVMVSTSGTALSDGDITGVIRGELLKLCTLVTPNIGEAEILAGMKITNDADIETALFAIHKTGAENVLIKGGHLQGEPVDTLLWNGDIYCFSGQRVSTKNSHGTGCTLSSAIAVFLAKGENLKDAVYHAKEYITKALEHSYDIGKGSGPVNHFWKYGGY